jgi:hypothetical protein
VPIFGNTGFRICRQNEDFFDNDFFENFLPGTLPEIRKSLSWGMLLHNGVFLDGGGIGNVLQTDVSVQAFARLKSGYKLVKDRYSRIDVGAVNENLNDFFNSVKKGSRKFRTVLYKNGNNSNVITRQIHTCASLIELPVPDPATAKILNKSWNNHNYGSELRVFIFKLHGNALELNERVAHFNANMDPACTFCTKSKLIPAERETFQHLFWYCNTTRNIIKRFEHKFMNIKVTKENFFYFKQQGYNSHLLMHVLI